MFFKRTIILLFVFNILFAGYLFSADRGLVNTTSSPYVKYKSVDMDAVRWTSGFWADKFNTAHNTTIPTMWDLLKDPEILHAWQNLRIVAGLEEGEFRGTVWQDGDFYKWIEAVSYVYALTGEKELDQLLDKVIPVLAKAQADDGYIHTSTMIGKGTVISRSGDRPYNGPDNVRWVRLNFHELYSMGHLLTASCIHYRATGKTSMLDVAKKCADYLYTVFEPRDPKLAHFGFNPSQIMGCVELYRTTKNQKYLELAEIFVEMRGSQPGGTQQNQARTPLKQEHEAVGHAVTANYLYCGATDLYAETGDKELLTALERVWNNMYQKKMYVTGATGAIHQGHSAIGDNIHEAYGDNYELPNSTGYNETCANIANGMWSYRMFSVTGDAKYADVMERVFYNSGISGISLDGKHYFYTNVLRRTFGEPFLSWDKPTRQPWLECFCCPSSLARTLSETNAYAYSLTDDGISVNLYGANVLNTKLQNGSTLKLTQKTDYPWDGKIQLVFDKVPAKEMSVQMRIPGWVRDASLTVNGKSQNIDLTPGTYVNITRKWSKNDVIELNLPMPVEKIASTPLVKENLNHVAIQRGPVVYCLESPDLPADVRVKDIVLDINSNFEAVHKNDFLGGVTVLQGNAFLVKDIEWNNQLYKSLDATPLDITLIPYYSWSNRGVTEMSIWLPINSK